METGGAVRQLRLRIVLNLPGLAMTMYPAPITMNRRPKTWLISVLGIGVEASV